MSKASKQMEPDLARRIPVFRSEKEEAEFWDTNEDLVYEILKRGGKVAGPLKVVKTEAISLRVDVEDLARAKEIAKKKGVGYQTVLKDAIRKAVRK